MVLTNINGQAVDKPHIYFIQAASGPILIGSSRAPTSTIIMMQNLHHEILRLMTHRPGDSKDVSKLCASLRAHHIRGGWYAPSPEVLEYVEGKPVAVGPAVRGGGRKLTREETVEVFRLAHGTSLTHAAIALRYGVAPLAVGRIARGEVHVTGPGALFKREAADDVPGAPPGWSGRGYYVSEVSESATKYRMTRGKRGPK